MYDAYHNRSEAGRTDARPQEAASAAVCWLRAWAVAGGAAARAARPAGGIMGERERRADEPPSAMEEDEHAP